MSLRAAFQRALNGSSSFILVADGEAGLTDSVDWSAWAGECLFWKMNNDAVAVRHLIAAIAAGVVPILIPPRTPQHKLDGLRADFPHFGMFDGHSPVAADRPVAIDPNIFLCLMTSGSTGKPKLIAATDISLTAGIAAIHKAQRLDPIKSTGVILPLAYSFAFVNQLLWAIYSERRLVLLPGLLDPASTFALIAQERVEMICMVAAQIQALTKLDFGVETTGEAVKVLNFAGAPFPISCYASIRGMFPAARIYNNYGCTEAMPRLSLCEMASADALVTRVGKPIEGITLRINGDPAGGAIEFSGASSSIGVLRADGRVEPHPDWIASGDLGRIDDNGDLHVLGRHDQVVKLAGERISLMEIEQSLHAEPIRDCVAWADATASEPRLLAVVSAPQAPRGPDLTRLLRERLPRSMWPVALYWVDEMPLLPNGKIDRVDIRRRAVEGELHCLLGGA